MRIAVRGMTTEFVAIPKKSVEFEDGSMADVSPFAISKSCVTVRMYRAFQTATGYVTVGQVQAGKLYYDNELIEHLPPDERANEPAFCMSVVDAMRFCAWAGVRLPTEAEWLAAAMIDNRVYDIEAGEECRWYDKRSHAFSDALRTLESALTPTSGYELTSSRARCGRFVVRNGPWYFRMADWRRQRLARWLVLPDEPDLLTSFRTCMPSALHDARTS